MKKPTTPTGNLGEKLAATYLKNKKYKILKTNWHAGPGEIDILALDHDIVVIVEVKTKTTPSFGHPAEMVNYYKQKKLLQLARYCLQYFEGKEVRIDVVSIDLSQSEPIIEHIENAVMEY
jgi:putative endonuclease